MLRLFASNHCFLAFVFLFLINEYIVFGQTKSRETFVFDQPDFLRKQKGIRLNDSAEFILFNNRERGYTELYQKGKVYWFLESAPNMLVVDRTLGDTVGTENYNVLTLEKNAKYQWVLGEGEDYGYFFRKGEIVLTVQTINKKRKCYVKIGYNPRDPNIEFIRKVAIYKAHKDLNLNHNQEILQQEESPYE